MKYIYKSTERYNSQKKTKVLIVLDDIITNIINNKTFPPIVTDLLIKGRK